MTVQEIIKQIQEKAEDDLKFENKMFALTIGAILLIAVVGGAIGAVIVLILL